MKIHWSALACGAALSLAACGKKTTPSPAPAETASHAPSAPSTPSKISTLPPPALSGSPWLTKNRDGTYSIDTRAECSDILTGSEPELALPPLTAAKGLRAELSADNAVAIQPLGLRAKLPAGEHGPPWVRTRGPDIEEVRRSSFEWERAYAELLDRSLPFESLLFHTGGEQWGRSAYFMGLGARLYALAESAEETVKNLLTRLPVVAARVSCGNQTNGGLMDSRKPSSVTNAERPPWKMIRTNMRVWYSDYGGEAVVEMFVRRLRDVTLVLVVMRESDERHAAKIAALADAFAKP